MQACESFLRSMKARLGEILDDASGLFHMVTEDTDPSEAAVARSGLQSFWHQGQILWEGGVVWFPDDSNALHLLYTLLLLLLC